MDFRILGELEVRDGAGRLCTLVRRKQRLLLAILLLEANRAVPTERIVDWLWDGQPPSSAVQNLHSYISSLRRQLDGHGNHSRIETQPGRYLLRVEPGELDAAGFEELVAQGRRAADDGQYSTAVERFTRALGLWRADTVLAGRSLPEPLRAETARLEQLREAVVEAAFDARLELGQHRELVPELEVATRRQPLRERFWAQRMLALYRADRQADALAVYQQATQTLATELGIDPGHELRRLHGQILNAEQTLIRPADTSSPPIRPAQLPADLTSFTGRVNELGRLLRLAGNDADQAGNDHCVPHHTVVISAIDGMAGVGKTALAVRAAHQLTASFPDGQLFVDLHGFTEGVRPIDPSEALDRLLRSTGVSGGQIPNSLDERAALWRTQLASRRLVVVLDNAANAAQVTPLLPGASSSVVLVTSRHRLTDLDDAQPLSLDVLALPDAVALFTRTAGADRLADQPFERIAEVVELCGRLPLAIRIAAARLRNRPTWALSDLAERVRDRRRLAELETGQRGVTAALQLSYAHLPEAHQRVFRLLGLHPGQDLDSYAAAALADLTLHRASRILDDLLDAHLLQQHRLERYRFHDLVRAYAAQVCGDSEPESARHAALTRLFDHYTHSASAAVQQLYPPEFDHQPRTPPPGTPAPVLDRSEPARAWLDAELPNLLAIPATAPADHTLHLCATLHFHLRARSRHDEAETLHTKALQAARQVEDRRSECIAMTGLAHARCGQGRNDDASRCFEAALGVACETGYRLGERHALNGLANLYLVQGRYQAAADYFEHALALARELGDEIGEIGALLGLGHLHRTLGGYELAGEFFETALGMAHDLGDRNAELIALNGLGRMHLLHDRYTLAADCYQRALTTSRQLSDNARELGALAGLANICRVQGKYGPAAERFEEVVRYARQSGNRNAQLEAWHDLGYTCAAAGRPDQAIEKHQRALELAEELSQPTDAARAHYGIASAYHALGDHRRAREHWLRTERIHTELGITRNEEVDLDEVRSRLAELHQLADDTS